MNIKQAITTAAAILSIGGYGVYEGTVSETPKDTILPGEKVEMRTANSKVWDTGKTVYDSTRKKEVKLYYARTYINDIHYYDVNDRKFKAWDLTVYSKPFIDAALSDRDFEINSGTWKADFEENKPYNFGYKLNKASISYKALFDTTDAVEIFASSINSGVKETIILKDKTAPVELQWAVSLKGTAVEINDGWDIYNSDKEYAFHVTKFTAKDANNKNVRVITTLDGGYIAAFVDAKDAEYPITIDPATTTVTGINDSWQRTSGGTPNYYATARDDANGESSFTNSTTPHQVGQQINMIAGPDSVYYVHRMFHQYVLAPSLNIKTITACSTYYYVKLTTYTEDDFLLYQIIGTQTGVPAATWFNDFLAWQASGQYIVTSTYLTTPKNTSSMSSGNYYYQPYTALGIDSLNACIDRADTHRVVFISERDIEDDAPLSTSGTTSRYSYLDISTSADTGKEPYLSITFTTITPTNFTVTSVSPTAVHCEWTDTITGETYYRVKNAVTGAYIDSTAGANQDSLTINGLSVNTKYPFLVEVVGGTANGAVSNADSCYTDANTPGVATRTAPSDSTVKLVLNVNSNPDSTEFAIAGIDTTSGDTLWVDFRTDPAILRSALAGYSAKPESLNYWRTYAAMGGASGVNISVGVGKYYRWIVKAISGSR